MDKEEPENCQDSDFNIILESLHYDYQDSKNVLIVWKALSYFLGKEVHIPNWVKLYFQTATEELLKIDTPEKKAPGLIQRALQIKGVHFKQLRYPERDEQIYELLQKERSNLKPGETIEDALKRTRSIIAKKDPLDISSIHKAYFRHKAIEDNWQSIVEDEMVKNRNLK